MLILYGEITLSSGNLGFGKEFSVKEKKKFNMMEKFTLLTTFSQVKWLCNKIFFLPILNILPELNPEPFSAVLR